MVKGTKGFGNGVRGRSGGRENTDFSLNSFLTLTFTLTS